MSQPNVEELINGFENALRSEWRQYREQSFNTNTKGGAYETALKELLQQYLGNILDIRTRSAIVDAKLDCFSLLTEGENEIDIVATYKTATPNIVFEAGDMSWVPYDGVSFLCEVKSSLSKSSLESDLEKIEKLVDLRDSPEDRFHTYTSTPYSVNHQLMCLVYDEENIADSSKSDLLEEYSDVWDLMLVVEEDEMYVNSTLPFMDFLFPTDVGDPHWIYVENGLAWFILALSTSIPYPDTVYAADPILNLISQQEDLSVTAGRISL